MTNGGRGVGRGIGKCNTGRRKDKMNVLLIMMAVVMVGGCVTSINEGPRMTVEQYQSIMTAEKEGSIKIGMSKKEVLDIIGEPQLKYKATYVEEGDEGWEYTSRSPNLRLPFAVSRPFWIWFKDGKVSKVQRMTKI